MHKVRRKVIVQKTILRGTKQVFDHFSKHHMKILLGDIKAKLGKEDNFKPTIGNGSLHQDSNDKGVRIVNFATSKN
jgi:hypothetical protein